MAREASTSFSPPLPSGDFGSSPSSFRRAAATHQTRTTFVSDAFRISGSVLPRIFPSVLFVTLYSAIIAIADIWYDKGWKTSNSVIGPLSVVVGLLIVFRNGTSYDRWYEGRKVWQDASATVKNTALLIWCNVDPGQEGKVGRRMERKKRAVRLLVAWMVAVKHHLRGQEGSEWEDLRDLLPRDFKLHAERRALNRRSFLYDGGEGRQPNRGNRQDEDDDDNNNNNNNNNNDNNDTQAGAAGSKAVDDIESRGALQRRNERRPLLSSSSSAPRAVGIDTIDLPTQLLTALHAYVAGLQRSSLLPSGPFHGVLVSNLCSLSQSFSNLTRISTTSIPLVYNIHLKQCCLLYLLALPLTLVGELSWRMIPVVSLVAITLMGLEGISSEIEDPFGFDRSDHNLDAWCEELRRDLDRLVEEVEDEIQDE